MQTQRKFSLSDWQSRTTSERKIEYLLDTYWEATITRELIIDPNLKQLGIRSKTYGKKPLPDRKAVRRTLVFAAKMLERESSTELLIERMQPTALITRRQKWAYRLIYGLIYGLINGLINGLIFGLNTIKPVEEISISMSREAQREILRSIRKQLINGLILGLSLGLILGLSLGLIAESIGALSLGLSLGLIYGLIYGLKADIQIRIKPNQGIKNSVKNMVIISGIAILMALPFKFVLEYFLINLIDSQLISGIVSGSPLVLIWYSFATAGGIALIQHLALRLVFAWNRYAPFRYDLLLNYCTERLLLQRIGGRYRFMHKLLQDHFAKMDLE